MRYCKDDPCFTHRCKYNRIVSGDSVETLVCLNSVDSPRYADARARLAEGVDNQMLAALADSPILTLWDKIKSIWKSRRCD